MFKQITNIDVEFDCYDQFGKHASGKITSTGYKGGQKVNDVTGSSTPSGVPKSQSKKSRTIKVILINSDTDATMLGANTATVVRYISNKFTSTLGENSYYNSSDGGREILLDAFNTAKESNTNNTTPRSKDTVYYNNKFKNGIGEDKVRVNINDYTK